MNKNFRKKSLIALMSMAIVNLTSGVAFAATIDELAPLPVGEIKGGGRSVVLGYEAAASGWTNVALGGKIGLKQGTEDTYEGVDNGVAIGQNSILYAGSANSVAIGYNSKTFSGAAVALGNGSSARAGNSVAIGNGASTNAGSSVAIGDSSVISSDRAQSDKTGISFTSGSKTGNLWVATSKGVVSIGSDATGGSFNRQLTGVAAGKLDNDAVNVAQLKDLKSYGDGQYLSQSSAQSTYVSKSTADNTYATKSSLNSYVTKTTADSTYLKQSDAQNRYATQASLGDYLKSADASNSYAALNDFDALKGKVTDLQTTLSGMDASTLQGIKDAVDNLGGVDLQKIQETVSKLDKLPQNGLLTITTSTAQQQPEDPVTPPEENNPEQQTVMAAAENDAVGDGTGEGTGGDVGGETSTPDTNKEATLGVGGKLNFVSSSNVLAQVENGENGDVNVKLDLAQDANVNSLTANSVTTETLQATTITAQDMELSGKLTANEIVATTAIQAPTIQFTDGAALTYSKDSGRLTYTTPAAEGDGTRAGGETFSVATTKDGISFGADEGESVLVNLEDQKVDIKGGDQYVTTSIVANADGGATVQIKMTDEFKAALGNGNLDNGITIGAKDGYGEIRVQQGNVDMGGNRIQNVGNPIAAGDAANKQYVDSTARSLRNKINDVDKDLRAGVAMAMAVGNLPQAYMPGKSIVGVSAGTYHGQGGFALGLSHATDNRQWVFKGAASVDTRGNVGGTLSAGYQF